MSQMITFHAGVPADLRALVWQVFFVSRGRGQSFNVHFPWADDTAVTAVCAHEQGRLVGGMVVREVCTVDNLRFGMIGLVCVAEVDRGRGWSHRLLDAAASLAQSRGLAALMLWTQKPDVYVRHGFRHDGAELLCDVDQTGLPPASADWLLSPEVAVLGACRGLPAFASAIRRLEREPVGPQACSLVLQTAAGAAVADWCGEADSVAGLLTSALPARWALNALSGDPLIQALERIGCKVHSRFTGARLVLWLQADAGRVLPEVRILDRI